MTVFLGSFDWSKPRSLSFTSESVVLLTEGLVMTGINSIRSSDAPDAAVLIAGSISGASKLSITGNSLANFGISNSGTIRANQLLLSASSKSTTLPAIYNSGVMEGITSLIATQTGEATGLINSGMILNESRTASIKATSLESAALSNFGSISLSGTIQGTSSGSGEGTTAIYNIGAIELLAIATTNKLTGQVAGGFGILNSGRIGGDSAKDIITGKTDNLGSSTGDSGLSNSGVIELSGGADSIAGIGGGLASGLFNTGTINLGSGNDKVTGVADASQGSFAIFNSGSIDFEDGNDILDASKGGIALDDSEPPGRISMGAGTDTFLGFGFNQFVSGGTGTDTLRLPRGTYDFTPSGLSSGAMIVTDGIGEMLFSTFERVGRIGQTSYVAFPTRATTLTI